MAPRLSVVLPVFQEARFLRGTLESLLAQSLPEDECEFLVADGGSTDGTREIVREMAAAHPCIRLLDNPGRRSSSGRNAGWRAAQAPCVLFIDGHVCIPSKTLLADVLAAFERGCRALARPQPLDPPGLTPFQLSVAAARASALGHQGASEIFGEAEGDVDPSSSGAGYTRELLEELGGYDERFDACEDVEFNERVKLRGLLARTSPAFTVRYYPREDLRGLWGQCERYGRGRSRMWRKHPHTLGPTVPLPALYFAVLAGLLGLAVFLPGFGSLAALWAAPYVAAVLLGSLMVKIRAKGPVALYKLPLIFAVIHAGFAWGFADETLRPRVRFR